MDSYVLALDVGTSACHCLLTDIEGSCVGTATAPMHYYTPEGCPELAREFEPNRVIATLGELVGKVLQSSEVRPGSIVSIALTSQRQGLVFLDERGHELYCGPNIDLRAIFEGAAIDEELGDEVYKTTGHFPSFLLAPARVRWFRANRRPIFDKVATLLSIASWLLFRLTRTKAAEVCLEGESGLVDINQGKRCHSLLKSLEVPESLLAPMRKEEVLQGCLTEQMAESWGLNRGTPVLLAGPDTQCGLLGMGLNEAGQVGALLGWSGAIQAVTERPCYDPNKGTWVGLSLIRGHYVAESNLGETGTAYVWLKDLLLGAGASLDQADELAASSSAEEMGYLAYLGPGRESSFRAGLRRGGLLFPTPFSFQQPSAGSLVRAALENIAFSVKANLNNLDQVTGYSTDILSLGGGMSKSSILAGILADVLGITIRRSKMHQTSARGAALQAIAINSEGGDPASLRSVPGRDYEDVFPRSPRAVVQYEETYQQWYSLYNRLDWD